MTARLVSISRGVCTFDDGTTLMIPGWVIVGSRSRQSWWLVYDGHAMAVFHRMTRDDIDGVIATHERSHRENLALYADMGASA